MSALPLTFAAPGAAMPPRHLADLDAAGRRAAVIELGEPGYRGDQLARHYFGRLSTDPETMTDLPVAARRTLGAALLPTLLAPVRHLACDGGTTRKTLWRAHDGTDRKSTRLNSSHNR
jgi:23S rRNA (adenine2503-C2)-methyltransferase